MQLNSMRILKIVALLVAPLISNSSAFAQDAQSGYRERFQFVGEMTRAAFICNTGKDDLKWFMDGGFIAIPGREFPTFSNTFKDTTKAWMEDGAAIINSKVMRNGIPSACEFARKERGRAEAVAAKPITATTPSDNDYENHKNYQIVLHGTCNFKFLNRDNFGNCDPKISFINYKAHRSAFVFYGNDGKALFVFEGGNDRQPDLEIYFLAIDKAKLVTLKDGTITGTQTTFEGECHMHLNNDASKYY